MRALAISLIALGACSGSDDDPIVELQPAIAQIDTRCRTADRIGVVQLVGSGNRIDFYAQMFDDKHPLIDEPTLADAACELHQFGGAFCESCGSGEICGPGGSCVAAPRPGRQLTAQVSSGGGSQQFAESEQLGFVFGEVTLPGPGFAITVESSGQPFVVDQELAIPGPLDGLMVEFTGDGFDDVGTIEATWQPNDGGTDLFTHVPINHHASGAFTECAVDASVGSLVISEPMLEPLAVVTGLEFQGFEHVRFAAAEGERGCVEFRMHGR